MPVFAVNYGAIGFLATVEPWELEEGIERALRGEFEAMELPALLVATGEGDRLAVNDISFHRRARRARGRAGLLGRGRGARARCAATASWCPPPAGSTGYNLANGGPVLAWGVEGFVVSFIAPHTLTARSLVVAPGDVLEVTNRSTREEVDVTTDGRPRVARSRPRRAMRIRFEDRQALLAQAPGATFYHRLRDKFGRLSY